MDKITLLLIGETDWEEVYNLPSNVECECWEEFSSPSVKPYEVTVWDRNPVKKELEALYQSITAYTLFLMEDVTLSNEAKELFEAKKGRILKRENIQEFLLKDIQYFFPKPYGEKFKPENLAVSHRFKGKVSWSGQYALNLQGSYGDEMGQIAYWRNRIPVFAGQTLDLWLEYKKSPDVEVELVVSRFNAGSVDEILAQEHFSEQDLNNVVRIEGGASNIYVFFSVCAKGEGDLQIIALHDRLSRGDYGYFVPGGERFVTSNKEEFFCYFNPMDRKPPLNVYFSGYKTKQGFEGQFLMNKMGSPYLLVAEPRLEGGAFYMGSEEYEQLMADTIRSYMVKLGFRPDDVILAGISMGSTGAAYYGCDLKPHALLLGKPLMSCGDIAENEQLFRPGGFPTSLDVLQFVMGDSSHEAATKLNDKMWKRFENVNWTKTKIIASYMIEDDYDDTAYEKLVARIQKPGIELYGRGLHGRHNDNSGGIVSWFVSQLRKMLTEDFGRKFEDLDGDES